MSINTSHLPLLWTSRYRRQGRCRHRLGFSDNLFKINILNNFNFPSSSPSASNDVLLNRSLQLLKDEMSSSLRVVFGMEQASRICKAMVCYKDLPWTESVPQHCSWSSSCRLPPPRFCFHYCPSLHRTLS